MKMRMIMRMRMRIRMRMTIWQKKLNNVLDEIIDKSKSFEDQIKLFKKVENLNEYWHSNDYGDKGLKSKIFKLKTCTLVKYHWRKDVWTNIWSYICNISK